MTRLIVPAALLLLGSACDALREELTTEPPPFEPTRFLDLAELDQTEAGEDLALIDAGRYLLVQYSGMTAAYDLLSLVNVGFASRQEVRQGRGWITVVDDLVILPLGVDGVDVVRFTQAGARYEPVLSTDIPAEKAFVSEDRVVLWSSTQLWVFDRAAFFGGAAAAEDAWFTREVSLLKSAAARGDTLWYGQDPIAGASAWDISDPSAPVELHVLGDWFAHDLQLYGDTLLVGQGYSAGAYDVSAPAAPAPLGRLWGGQGMSVFDGYYYAVDRSNLYILDLDTTDGVPAPAFSAVLVSEDNRFINHMGDCTDVVAGPHGVFVACAGELLWLGPNVP